MLLPPAVYLRKFPVSLVELDEGWVRLLRVAVPTPLRVPAANAIPGVAKDAITVSTAARETRLEVLEARPIS